MFNKQQYQAYAAATQTVARTRQIVMLYDGAIRYLQQAGEAMAENKVEERYNLLVKASEIISGLQGCLDFENGGDVAQVLYSFYAGIDLRIFALHRSPSKEECDQVVRELKQMRETWHEIDQMTSGGDEKKASAEAPVKPAATKKENTASGAPPETDLSGVTLSA